MRKFGTGKAGDRSGGRVAGRTGSTGAGSVARAMPRGVPPCFSAPALGVSPLPSMQWPVRYYPDARTRGEREEIGDEKICLIVGVGGDSVVARRGRPSSSPFRFRENWCWRLRWGGLHRRFFCHPSRRVRPCHGSFDDKVRSAGQARRVSRRAGGNHVSDDQIDLAPIVAERRVAGTTSLRAIAAELNGRGIPSATDAGSSRAPQVRRLLARLRLAADKKGPRIAAPV